MDVAETVGETSWSANMIGGKLHILYYRDVRDASVSVYSVSGQKVQGLSGRSYGMGDEEIMDFSTLPAGVYMIQVSGGGISRTLKTMVK